MIDLDKIPSELHPALNRIAFEIASFLGWSFPTGFNFSTSKSPRAIKMYRMAIISTSTLNEYCLDGYGIGLADLAGLIEEENAATETENSIILL